MEMEVSHLYHALIPFWSCSMEKGAYVQDEIIFYIRNDDAGTVGVCFSL